MTQYVLLNPGPVNVHERVRAALLGPDLCHREPEYFDLQDDIRAGLVSVFGLDPAEYAAVLVTGSGTAALEAAVSSSVPDGGRMLVVRNGVYGERIATMCAAHGIACDTIDSEWTERPDVDAVADRLATGDYAVLAAVHHETTTGLINPIGELGALAHQHGVPFVVDTISGLAGEPFDFAAVNPAIAICTANKCLEGLPGISFVLAKRAALGAMAGYSPRSLYFHLPNAFDHQERRSTPFTPAIQIGYALRAAIELLKDETVDGRLARYTDASTRVRDGAAALGIECLLPPELRSNTITTFELPDGVTYPALHDALKARGYIIYAGQGKFAETAFRVANMGQITSDQITGFVTALDEALAELR